MTPKQVIEHYGSELAAATALQLSRQAVNYWKMHNTIPMRTQALIQLRTNGALKAAVN